MKSIARGPAIATVHENGEIIDSPKKSRRRPSRKDGPLYVMLELEAATRAADSLTRTEEKVLNTVLSKYSATEPYARMTVSELAGYIGVARQNAHSTVKKLIARGFLYRISATAWAVNPHYGFRGSREEWQTAIDTAEEPTW